MKVIKIGRVKFENEEEIATDAFYSFVYALHNLKGRFELGEEVIYNHDSDYYYDDDCTKEYFENVICKYCSEEERTLVLLKWG